MTQTEVRPLAGPVALVGGNEFCRECVAMDQVLLALAGGRAARVVIVPTAATNVHPEVAAEHGRRHFQRLGARAESVLVVDSETANDPALATQLAEADLVYLTGGDPVYLLETLAGSLAWRAVEARARTGALVAGAGAGAMALGALAWRFDGWTAGLGLARGLAVVPHHASLAKRWDTGRLAASLPAGVSLVGIDDATALVLPARRVLGSGQVKFYQPRGTER